MGTSENALNVFQRLSKVRSAVSYLKKEKEGQQFSYVGSSDVLGALHKAINDNGLLLIPSITAHKLNEKIETVSRYDKYKKKDIEKDRVTYFTEIEMNMRWQNIDDRKDYIDCSWYAQGVDIEGEKGVGKALTYGEKYFLLKFFNIATDKDDPDSFQRKQESKLPPEPPKLVSGQQVAKLKDEARQIADISGQSPDLFLGKIAEIAQVESIEYIYESAYKGALAQLIKWKQGYQKQAKEQEQEQPKQNEPNWGKK